MSVENKTFDKVYNKLVSLLEKKVYSYTIKRKYGGNINIKELKMLAVITAYLEGIKNSDYKYYHIKKLTEISNYLNKI